MNVTRNVLKINLYLDTGREKSPEKFNLTLIQWTTTEMIVNIDFADPKQISNGVKEDRIELEIINTKLFVSKQSGFSLIEGNYETNANVPRQLPKYVSI